ncbi:MAG: alpha-2-macroglobulin family protein, partial [Myxococcota bacterium]
DDRSEPVANATFTLWVPERSGERTITGTTDIHGHARFTWTPYASGSRTLRLKVVTRDGRALSHSIEANIRHERVSMRVDALTVAVDQPFELQVDHLSRDAVVVAFNRHYPVGASTVPHTHGRTTLTLGAAARGLTTLVVFGDRNQTLASTRIWVSQRGGDEVTLIADQPTYRPGALATLRLAFPPKGDPSGASTPEQPVTFGLMGVDEALYALKERLDVPLTILLRHSPEEVSALQDALAVLERDVPDERLAQTIARAQFAAKLGQGNVYSSYGRDISREVYRAARRPWLIAWMLFLSLLILAATVQAGWTFWSTRDKGALSWQAALALLGVALAALAAGVVMAVGGSPEFLAGGLVVWLGVVICWVVATALERRDLPLGRWTLAVGTTVFVLGCIGVSVADDGRAVEGWPIGVVLVAAGLAGLTLIAGVIAWGLILMHQKMRKPALGLGTLLGLPLAMLLGSMTMVAGGNYAMEEAMQSTSARLSDAPASVAGKRPPTTDPEPGGSGGPRLRSYFPETMLWMPELRSDAQGQARVATELPDSITTWRIEATASTWDGRMGYARLGVPVLKPFFVEVDLPTHT